jgi:hypothetical protein
MDLRYDEELLEAAVFLCARGGARAVPALQLRRFQCERDGLYLILDPTARNDAFYQLHLAWFREWGLERDIAGAIRQFPIFLDACALEVLAFRKARSRADEGAELYVNESQRAHGVVALRPEHFASSERLQRLLNHELTHLSDLLDPEFGFHRESRAAGLGTALSRLVRERYRILWDLSIDGRCHRRGMPTTATLAHRRAEFDGAFSFLPESERDAWFQQLWFAEQPTHDGLWGMASDPRHFQSLGGPAPGAPCPCCGFSTFEWSRAELLGEAAGERLRADVPGWSVEQGLCTRCAEVYACDPPPVSASAPG